MSDPADIAKRAIKVMTRATNESLTEAHDAAMKAAAKAGMLHCNKCGRSVPAVAYVIGVGKLCQRCYVSPVRPKRGKLRDFLERIAASLARRWARRS